jgi:hypothetical protein
MPAYEIIVTDVTCYGPTLFCVAGCDRHTGHMIRPEPPGANVAYEPSRFWNGNHAGPGRIFDVGNVVRFEANMPPADFPFPHATEDRIVDPTRPVAVLERLTLPNVAEAVAPGVSGTLEDAFDDGLVRAPSSKAYVTLGHQGRSLGAVELAPNHLTIHINSYDPAKPKLRAYINVGQNVYDLSVTAAGARQRWLADGVDALREDVHASDRLHVRVGLSRPFPAMPHHCYAQVNGLYFL